MRQSLLGVKNPVTKTSSITGPAASGNEGVVSSAKVELIEIQKTQSKAVDGRRKFITMLQTQRSSFLQNTDVYSLTREYIDFDLGLKTLIGA